MKYKVTFIIESSEELNDGNLGSMDYAIDHYGFYDDERIVESSIEKLPDE